MTVSEYKTNKHKQKQKKRCGLGSTHSVVPLARAGYIFFSPVCFPGNWYYSPDFFSSDPKEHQIQNKLDGQSIHVWACESNWADCARLSPPLALAEIMEPTFYLCCHHQNPPIVCTFWKKKRKKKALCGLKPWLIDQLFFSSQPVYSLRQSQGWAVVSSSLCLTLMRHRTMVIDPVRMTGLTPVNGNTAYNPLKNWVALVQDEHEVFDDGNDGIKYRRRHTRSNPGGDTHTRSTHGWFHFRNDSAADCYSRM